MRRFEIVPESSPQNAQRMTISTRDMAIVSLFAVLTGVGAMIRIPLPFSPIPMTLQTAMVFFAGTFLGSRRASLAMTMYMAMGLIGLPVFTQGGGFHNIMTPSFGFIIGFIPASWIIGKVCELTGSNGQKTSRYAELIAAAFRASACFLGFLAYNVVGVLWLHMNINYLIGRETTLYQSITMGLLPFIVPDMLKLGAVVVLTTLVRARVKESGFFAK